MSLRSVGIMRMSSIVLVFACCIRGLLLICSDHITELGNQRPTKPFYFLKPWTSIIPPDSLVVDEFNPRYKVRVKKPSHNVLIPNGVNVHYEVELAVIFQKEVSDLAYQRSKLSAQAYEELWKDAIGGYALGTISIVLLTHFSHRFDCKKSAR